MKQTGKRLLALTLCCVMLIGMMCAVSVSAATDKVLDVDFSREGDLEKMISTSRSATSSIDQTGGPDGSPALKLTATSAGNSQRFFNSQNVLWEKGATYTISYQAKYQKGEKTSSTKALTGWLAPNFAYKDENGKGYNFPASGPTYTTEWKTYSYSFTIADFVNSGSDLTSKNVDSLQSLIMLNISEVEVGDILWIDNFTVTKKKTVAGEIISLDLSSTSETYLKVGKTSKLVVKGTDTEETEKTLTSGVTFSSSNEKVATVSADGTVTAKCEGYSVITAKCDDAERNIVFVVGNPVEENTFDTGTTINTNVTSEIWGESGVKWENAQEIDADFKRNGTASLHLKNLNRTKDGTTAVQGPTYIVDSHTSDSVHPTCGAFSVWFYDSGNQIGNCLLQIFSSETKSKDEMAEWTTLEKYPYQRFNFSLDTRKSNGYQLFGDGFKNGEYGTFDLTIPRTKGWHQLVEITTSSGHEVYIDGQLFASVQKPNQHVGRFMIHRIIPKNETEGNNELWLDDFVILDTTVSPKAPVVDSVRIEGSLFGGQTLTAHAVVSDMNPEDTASASYQWEYLNEANKWTAITGAVNNTYTIDEAYIGKKLRVAVTPLSSSQPSPGAVRYSDATAVVKEYVYPPSATGAAVSGTFAVGEVLTADYTYVPSQSEVSEDKTQTQIIWETSSSENG